MMGSSSSHMWGYAAAVFHEGNRGMARVHTRPQGHGPSPKQGHGPSQQGHKEVLKRSAKKKSRKKKFRKEVQKRSSGK